MAGQSDTRARLQVVSTLDVCPTGMDCAQLVTLAVHPNFTTTTDLAAGAYFAITTSSFQVCPDLLHSSGLLLEVGLLQRSWPMAKLRQATWTLTAVCMLAGRSADNHGVPSAAQSGQHQRLHG